jgi:hypothetical protein
MQRHIHLRARRFHLRKGYGGQEGAKTCQPIANGGKGEDNVWAARQRPPYWKWPRFKVQSPKSS